MSETVTTSDIPATVLFVDDEASILSSLKRLFRPFGYRILTAENGAQGLEVLAQERVDLVVSDMRMPGMSGAQFLEKVRERWPETVRILLTGYAEMSATIEAINKGQIYRYVSKPWEDNDITLTVKHALQQKKLEREKQRLEELTYNQNEELKDLNAHLEEKVLARTNALNQSMQLLDVAHERLKKSFITSVRVFSNLIEMRNPSKSGHSRRVADLARLLAQSMGMSAAEVQDTFIAGLLLDIGKIGLPDRLQDKPLSNMTFDERAEVFKYPVKGEMALMALEQLQGAAKLIRSHRERFDGGGYPEHLSGLSIPLGARILSVAKDYDTALMGTDFVRPLNQAQALLMLQDGKSKCYDPAVLNAFLEILCKISSTSKNSSESIFRAGQLKPGMVLSRDLMSTHGEMLLSKGHVLDENIIDQIRGFDRMNGHPLTIHIQT
ncbi:MAG: HD domain-containing phosphohydrolase [Gallionella sp.]|jgi:response regulator RpfG family c-di-GMP phosphodiesterase